jgi:hypothetical protein
MFLINNYYIIQGRSKGEATEAFSSGANEMGALNVDTFFKLKYYSTNI